MNEVPDCSLVTRGYLCCVRYFMLGKICGPHGTQPNSLHTLRFPFVNVVHNHIGLIGMLLRSVIAVVTKLSSQKTMRIKSHPHPLPNRPLATPVWLPNEIALPVPVQDSNIQWDSIRVCKYDISHWSLRHVTMFIWYGRHEKVLQRLYLVINVCRSYDN